MVVREPAVYDVVGVGFGPSNLSLAVALDELRGAEGRALTARFFERQVSFGWHRNMLLPAAKMQVSFLKDLVTFRNPHSRFSFVSYLHEMNRLAWFVNNCDFFPTRAEFHGYLEWVAANFVDQVTYDASITAISVPTEVAPGDPVDRMRVHVAAGSARAETLTVDTRNIVLGTGLVPRMPSGLTRDDRVWHSSEFLDRFQRRDTAKLNRVVVVGAGQSAAELARYVYDSVPHATVTAIIPSYGYSIADNTPFANRVFDPDAIDDYYYGDEGSKDAFWHYHKNTNYAVVDSDVIRDLHRKTYDEAVGGASRLRFVALSRVNGVRRHGDGVVVSVHSLASDRSHEIGADLVICATGYEPMEIKDMLGPLDGYCLRDDRGRYRIERDYRITTTANLRCGIYLQGGMEHTHGLSSSLLSNLAVRGGDISQSIHRQTHGRSRENGRALSLSQNTIS